MNRELASLDEVEVSSEQLKKQLLGQEQPEQVEEVLEEEVVEEVDQVDDEVEDEVLDEVDEVPEQTVDHSAVELQRLRDQNRQLTDIMSQVTQNKNQVKPVQKPVLTTEEELESLATQPKSFVNGAVDEKLQPIMSRLQAYETQQALNVARQNKDFVRLEPLIEKIKQQRPNMMPGASAIDSLEAYYHIARSLDMQERDRKSQDKTSSDKKKRMKAKKNASTIPKSSKNVNQSTPKKTVDKMTAAELKKHMQGLA